jgi:hypothetical protein
MISMQDTDLTVYPNREQMLALIRARAAANAEDGADEPSSADSETPFPNCIAFVAD